MRILKTPAFWLLSVALTIVVTANWNNESSRSGRANAGEGDAAKLSGASKGTDGARQDHLIREGTELTNLRVQIRRASNGRVTLHDEQTKRSMVCLENLWLQRILAAQKNEEAGVMWTVSGRVSEFESTNYLQIMQASKAN